MSKVKNTMYAMIGTASLVASNLASAINWQGSATAGSSIKGVDKSADEVVKSWIAYAVGFLYFVAVAYGLYGGWTILTAGGDEKKVGTGKSIIIRAVLGLIVVFLANSIVKFIIEGLFGTGTNTQQ